jgi:diketogulonate reductase-like aldo/keto reductase
MRRNMPRFQGDNLRHNLLLVEELGAHAQAENCTPAQLALAWLLAQKPFVVPIAGTSHVRRPDSAARVYVVYLQAEEIAAAEFAVDRQVEQGEVALAALELKTDPNCADIFRLEGTLLACQAALVPRSSFGMRW